MVAAKLSSDKWLHIHIMTMIISYYAIGNYAIQLALYSENVTGPSLIKQ